MTSFCFTNEVFNFVSECKHFRDLRCKEKFSEGCFDVVIASMKRSLANNICIKSFVSIVSLGNRISYIAKTNEGIRDLESSLNILAFCLLLLAFVYFTYYILNKIE